MPTIGKAPMLRQGDRGPQVKDLQNLLNESNESNLEKLDPDGVFGSKTLAKVIEFQKGRALQPDGIAGPLTNAELFRPLADVVDGVQGIATTWTLLARGAVDTIQGWVRSLRAGRPSGSGNLRIFLKALQVHFHITLPMPESPESSPSAEPSDPAVTSADLDQAEQALRSIKSVLDDVLDVLNQASIREGRVFCPVGPEYNAFQHGSNVPSKSSAYTTFAHTKSGKEPLIFLPKTFLPFEGSPTFRTTSQQASTILHECCHYVRLTNNHDGITDWAYGVPPPGKIVKGVHNYRELTVVEALHNAECYNLFAEHVTFLRDTRFGRFSSDEASFTCGYAELN